MSKLSKLGIPLRNSLPSQTRNFGSNTRSSYAKGPPQNSPKCPSLSFHWDTTPPTTHQLMKAAEFFQRASTEFLWSKEKFKDMPFGENFGESPEVCFLGRSNVGKSSLLNTLLCKRLAFTSTKPGRTRFMSAFAVKPSTGRDNDQLIVIDLPGYGKGGRAEWGKQIIKYLENRRQLKRAFLLIDSEHGIKKTDMQMLALLDQIGVPFQVILSKVDKIIPSTTIENNSESERLKEVINEIREALSMTSWETGPGVGEIIPCSSTKWMFGRRLGINELRFAILRAAEMEFREPRPLLNPIEIIGHDQLFPSEDNNSSEQMSDDECKELRHGQRHRDLNSFDAVPSKRNISPSGRRIKQTQRLQND